VGDDGTTAQAPGPQADQRRQAEAPLEKVAVATFNDVQQVWKEKIRGYREAKLVLFWDEVQSRCGEAAAEMGPFYCPADERVYIDLGFYRELSRRFGAPGDFAQAYVIAHEEGHHVQHVLGIGGKVQRAMQQDPSRRNALSVRLELQRPIASPACGAIRRPAGNCWTRATWTRAFAQRRRSATTGSSKRRAGASRRRRSRTVRRRDRARWFRTGLETRVGRSLRHLRRLVGGRHTEADPRPHARHTWVFHA